MASNENPVRVLKEQKGEYTLTRWANAPLGKGAAIFESPGWRISVGFTKLEIDPEIRKRLLLEGMTEAEAEAQRRQVIEEGVNFAADVAQIACRLVNCLAALSKIPQGGAFAAASFIEYQYGRLEKQWDDIQKLVQEVSGNQGSPNA